jgi:hypothetical protein
VHRSLQIFTEGSTGPRYDSIAQIVGLGNVNITIALRGPAMPSECCCRLDPARGDLCPIDMTHVDFSALADDEDLRAAARGLVRDQLVRTGEAVAWRAWEVVRARLRRLPGLEGAVIRPTRAEAEALGYMDAAGRELEREIIGARRRALEAQAVRELRAERARRDVGQFTPTPRPIGPAVTRR